MSVLRVLSPRFQFEQFYGLGIILWNIPLVDDDIGRRIKEASRKKSTGEEGGRRRKWRRRRKTRGEERWEEKKEKEAKEEEGEEENGRRRRPSLRFAFACISTDLL